MDRNVGTPSTWAFRVIMSALQPSSHSLKLVGEISSNVPKQISLVRDVNSFGFAVPASPSSDDNKELIAIQRSFRVRFPGLLPSCSCHENLSVIHDADSSNSEEGVFYRFQRSKSIVSDTCSWDLPSCSSLRGKCSVSLQSCNLFIEKIATRGNSKLRSFWTSMFPAQRKTVRANLACDSWSALSSCLSRLRMQIEILPFEGPENHYNQSGEKNEFEAWARFP
jgi:hypothetical protein